MPSNALSALAGIDLYRADLTFPGARGFSGIVFDGRYTYLIPLNNGQFHGQVLRHDTQQPFTEDSAWSSFDSAQIHPDSRGFVDGLFDGRYLYLVPFCIGRHHGQVTRYDTQAPFDDPAAWQVFDSATVHPNSRGFVSGCFDGRYIYLSPYQLDFVNCHGQVTRYDTQAGFDDPAAWQVFDTTQLHPLSRGFHSAIHSGDFVYLVPYMRGGKEYSGLVVRYDRRREFTDAAAWRTFDLTTLNERACGFVGCLARDGMLYFVPYFDGHDRYGQVARYNTAAALDDAAAWTFFDTAQVNPGSRGFFGAAADAEHLYLVPHCRGVGQYHGQITRYDWAGEFTQPGSWSICDTARAHVDCRGFISGVVHAGHLYLAPFETDAGQHSGLVLRLNLQQENLWSAG